MLTVNSPVNFNKASKALPEFNVFDDKFFKAPQYGTGKMKHVVGGKFINDAIGPFMKTSVYGTYAIHLPFSKHINFGAGLGLGFSNFSINESRVILHEENDIAYNGFLGATSAQNFFDANAGLVFYGEKFYAGLSMFQAFNNSVVFNDISTTSNYNRHFFLNAKYILPINADIDVEPSAVGKYVANSPMSFDFGARMVYKKASWFGVQYRTSNAIILQAGSTLIKNLYLAYAYEISTGKISTANNGTHEIQLGIYFGNNRNIEKEIKENKKEH